MDQPSPVAAQALGLAVVYQHLSILEDLTVAENMVFAMPAAPAAAACRATSAWTSGEARRDRRRIDPRGACRAS